MVYGDEEWLRFIGDTDRRGWNLKCEAFGVLIEITRQVRVLNFRNVNWDDVSVFAVKPECVDSIGTEDKDFCA